MILPAPAKSDINYYSDQEIHHFVRKVPTINLSPVDEDEPMVFAPDGYRSTASLKQEFALLCNMNCLHQMFHYVYFFVVYLFTIVKDISEMT
jgi:hypothetical protein